MGTSPPFARSFRRPALPTATRGAVSGRLHLELHADGVVREDEANVVSEPTASHAFSRLDLLIAATAAVHGLVVVTRNLADFLPAGVPTLDPWTGRMEEASPGAR